VKQSYNDKTHVFDVVPDLAAALPTVSKDGLTYTFKIRSDAKFSDGTSVTAQTSLPVGRGSSIRRPTRAPNTI